MPIYCPSCGTEAANGQQYCRKCGVNLFLIGKALTLGETIARGDRGPLPKVKAVMEDMKLDKVSEDIGRGLEQMNREITRSVEAAAEKHKRRHREDETERRKGKGHPWWYEPKTPEERRADLVQKGATSLFSGVGLMIALYFIAANVVLKIPPEQAARIPFELEPVIRMAWLIGLIPALTGLGQLVGALASRSGAPEVRGAEERPALGEYEAPQEAPQEPQAGATTGALEPPPIYEPGSVTEQTTSLLEEERRRAPNFDRAGH